MGFFRDFKDDMILDEDMETTEYPDQKTNGKGHEEENVMSDFEDANVDKDLLSQLLSEDSDDSSLLKDDLFADSSEDSKEEYVQEEIPDFILPKEPVEELEKSEEEEEKQETVLPVEDEPAQEDEMPADKAEEEVNDAKDPVENDSKPAMDGDVTVITKGTTINGGVSSDGSLEIMGSITGDVDCLGKLSVYGQISGNVTASDVIIKTKRLEGNVESVGSVEVATGTVVIGDITGTSASISGAVKGNIDVNGPVIVDSTAIVKGSIKAKSIQVNNGAVVDGYCSLNYAGVDLDDFFEEK